MTDLKNEAQKQPTFFTKLLQTFQLKEEDVQAHRSNDEPLEDNKMLVLLQLAQKLKLFQDTPVEKPLPSPQLLEAATVPALAEQLDEAEIQTHATHYSEQKLWDKLKQFAKKAGATVVYGVLLLYFTLQRPDVPKKAKLTIIGALGYFILPLDLIPDVMPGIGYADDLSAILFALMQIATYIDDDVKTSAKEKLTGWFGDDTDVSVIERLL